MSQLTIPVQYFRMGLNHARDAAERAALGKNPGPWLMDAKAIDMTMADFAAQGKPQPVDWDHLSIQLERPAPFPERLLCCGRVLDLKPVTDAKDAKDNGLWGITRYTEEASGYIRDEKINWTSPVFGANIKDMNRVFAFRGAALTPDPAMHLNEIRASLIKRGEATELEMLEFLKINLQLAETINFGAGPFSAGAHPMNYPILAKIFGLDAKATAEEIEAKATAVEPAFAAAKAEFASIVGLKADASLSDITAKAKEKLNAATLIPAGQDLNAAAAQRVNSLTLEIAELKVSMAKRDAVEAVVAHMTGAIKRISPAEKDSMIQLATTNRPLFDALMLTKAPIVENTSPTNGKGITSPDAAARGREMAIAASKLEGIPLIGAAS